jgi:hypothetical protein
VFETRGLSHRDAGNCLGTFAQFGFLDHGDISALKLSPDASVLYSGASDGTVAAWSLSVSRRRAHEYGIKKGFL